MSIYGNRSKFHECELIGDWPINAQQPEVRA